MEKNMYKFCFEPSEYTQAQWKAAKLYLISTGFSVRVYTAQLYSDANAAKTD
jgi:hypothetical protein